MVRISQSWGQYKHKTIHLTQTLEQEINYLSLNHLPCTQKVVGLIPMPVNLNFFFCQGICLAGFDLCCLSLTLISTTPQISCHMARWDYSMYMLSITYLRAKTNMNKGKSDIIAKRKVQALFTNKQKYKYDNHMQIMLMNINDITI